MRNNTFLANWKNYIQKINTLQTRQTNNEHELLSNEYFFFHLIYNRFIDQKRFSHLRWVKIKSPVERMTKEEKKMKFDGQLMIIIIA